MFKQLILGYVVVYKLLNVKSKSERGRRSVCTVCTCSKIIILDGRLAYDEGLEKQQNAFMAETIRKEFCHRCLCDNFYLKEK